MEHTTRPGSRRWPRVRPSLRALRQHDPDALVVEGPAKFVEMAFVFERLADRGVIIIGARPSADGQSCENKNRTEVSPSPAKVSPEKYCGKLIH